MGLHGLRKPFVATPLGMKDKDGKEIPFDKRADKAAEIFGTIIWGKQPTPPTIINQKWKTQKRITQDLNMDIADINMDVLCWAIRKLKRNKAAIEFFKEMQEPQLQIILELINKWWNGEPIPAELTQAQVILLYKKGDKNNLANYRPISLLNSYIQNHNRNLTKEDSYSIRYTFTEDAIWIQKQQGHSSGNTLHPKNH